VAKAYATQNKPQIHLSILNNSLSDEVSSHPNWRSLSPIPHDLALTLRERNQNDTLKAAGQGSGATRHTSEPNKNQNGWEDAKPRSRSGQLMRLSCRDWIEPMPRITRADIWRPRTTLRIAVMRARPFASNRKNHRSAGPDLGSELDFSIPSPRVSDARPSS
jgi:hypothetical protein